MPALPTRRRILLVCAGLLVTACSGRSRRPAAAGTSPVRVVPTTSTTPSVPPAVSAAGSPTTPSPGGVTVLGSRHVAGDVVTRADAARFGPLVDGSWAGAWRDDAGRSGTTDVTLTVDPARLTARGTLTFDGPLLAGSPVPQATYEIDLLGFARSAPSWTVVTPQFGTAAVTADGGVSATATCHDLPGVAGARLEMTGTRLGSRVDVRYTITEAGGRTTHGTAAWAKGAVRPTPLDPSNTRHDSISDVLGGAYASDFLASVDLAKVLGRPVKAPVDNGGRVGYAPGIDVSNTFVETADGWLRVDLQVYRATSAAAATAFWKTLLRGQARVAGPWKAGFFQGPGATPFSCLVGTLVLELQVGPTVAGASRTPATTVLRRDCQAVAQGVARVAARR